MSLVSLGSYAVRVYGTWSDHHQQINDLVHQCLSSLSPPLTTNPTTSGEWKAKEIVKIKSLLALSSVSGALEMYWKALRLHLSSAIPQLSPAHPPLSSELLNLISLSRHSHSDVPNCVSPQDIERSLRVVIQLTDGGAELSEIKTLFPRKASSSGGNKKKNKKKESEGGGESIPNIVEEEVTNALSKLESLCEVESPLFNTSHLSQWLWNSVITNLDEERRRCETEKEINAVRVEIHKMNTSTSSPAMDLVTVVTILIWTTFLSDQKRCENKTQREVSQSSSFLLSLLSQSSHLSVSQS
jgi:hypothetical protein